MKEDDQLNLFGAPSPTPEGFRYQTDLLSEDEERELLPHIQTLPFEGFQFHGFVGKRRVVSFGWRYDFSDAALRQVAEIPPFLLPLRARAAVFAGLAPEAFRHALVTEYPPGAGIGW